MEKHHDIIFKKVVCAIGFKYLYHRLYSKSSKWLYIWHVGELETRESVNLFSWQCTFMCKHLYHCSLLELSKQKGDYSFSQIFFFFSFCWIFCCFLTLKLMKFYVFMFLFFIILYFVDTFSVVFFNSPSQVSISLRFRSSRFLRVLYQIDFLKCWPLFYDLRV